jgi:bacterioferritin-associated ferredoxin
VHLSGEKSTHFFTVNANATNSYLESRYRLIPTTPQHYPMIVCVCHRVSDKEIHQHASEGKSFEDIQIDLGVATQCGRCEDCARDVVERCHANAALVHGAWKTMVVTRRM